MTRTPNKLYIRQFGAMMIINDQHSARLSVASRQCACEAHKLWYKLLRFRFISASKQRPACLSIGDYPARIRPSR
jgi:hypothetical protein